MLLGDSPSVYRAICESMACGVMLIDAQGRIETFNLAAAAILGLEREAVLHRNFAAVFIDTTSPTIPSGFPVRQL